MKKIIVTTLCLFITSSCTAQNEHINEEIRAKVAILHELSTEARKEKSDLNSEIVFNILLLENSLYSDFIAKSESQDQKDKFNSYAHFVQNTLSGILQCQTHICTQEQTEFLNTRISDVLSEYHQQKLDQLLK